MFTVLFEKLFLIEGISCNYKESWVNLTFEGVYQEAQIKTYFVDLLTELDNLGLSNSVTFFIGNNSKNVHDFEEELSDSDKWKVSINKNVSLNKLGEISNTFFYSKDKFVEWVKNSNPFGDDHPLNNKPCRIVVRGVENDFGGRNFMVCGHSKDFSIFDWDGYDESQIINNVHVISSSKFILKPLNHYVSYGEVDEVSKYFFRNSILVLLASLSNELYENNQIILKGYRRVSLNLGFGYNGKEITKIYQGQLGNAVQWVYQNKERCDLRLKLILERITLDVDYSLPYIQGLYTIIQEATLQAQERYSFIIYDRKDLYQKELKDFLKDIKGLTDSFTLKIRNVLSNLLRDVLAAFILVGITLFSKVAEIERLFENQMIKYVFIAFGTYFVCSAILQLTIDSFDLYRSNKEFDYWKNISREYLSKQEYQKHKKETFGKRMSVSIIMYLLIILLYITIGVFCFKFPNIWGEIMYPLIQNNY